MGDDGEDEVVDVIRHRDAVVAQAYAEEPAGAQRLQALDHLVAVSLGIGPRVEKTLDPSYWVMGDVQHQVRAGYATDEGGQRGVQKLRPGGKVEREGDHDQNHRRPQGWLAHDEDQEGHDDDREGNRAVQEAADPGSAARQPVGQVDDQGQLSDLGRGDVRQRT